MKIFSTLSSSKILLACFAVGILWVLFSDKIMGLLFNSENYWKARVFSDGLLIAAAIGALYGLMKNRQVNNKLGEDIFSDVFEFATVGIFQSSPEGKFIRVNPAMAAIYGYTSPEEMLAAVNDISRQIHISVESRNQFIEILEKQGVVEKFESKNWQKDGSIIWTSTNARTVRDQNGKILYYEGFVTDITRQKNAEITLRDTEKQYRTLIEQMPAAAYIASGDGTENIFSTPRMFSISGYTMEEWQDNPRLWMNIIHPDDRLKVQTESEKIIQSGETFNIEYRIIAKDSRVVWIHDVASLILDENNSPLYRQGILVDVTREKTAEEQIKTNEAQYRMVVEHASDGIIVANVAGKIFEANQQICRMLGFTRDELLGHSLVDLFPEDELQTWDINEISRGRAVVTEISLKRKDGTLLLVELSLTSLPNNMLMGIARNISNRKLMEEALARSEKKFRVLIENSMDAMVLFSKEGKILFQSPAASRILGYPVSEMIGKNIIEFVYTEDKPKAHDAIQKIIRHPDESVAFTVRCVCNDKSTKWIEFNGTNHLSDTDIDAIIFNYRNVTEHKIFENALFEAEERYRLLVEKLPAVIFMDKFDDKQTSQYMSPRIKDLLGYTAEEWENDVNLWETSLHPDDRERVLAEDIRTNETNEPFRIEYRMRHRDGHYVWIKEDASIIKSEEGVPLFWQGVLLDITQQKQAEEALKRRDAILRTVGISAEQFLKSTDWKLSIEKILAQLGTATGVSRVYIFKRESKTGMGVVVSRIYEWCDEGIIPHPSAQEIDLKNEGFSRWMDFFDKGLPLSGSRKEFPPEEQGLLQKEGILSIACIPIYVETDWWGFIGFDDNKTEREWINIEIDALRAAANTLGTSIERKLSEEALFRSEVSYRGLFNAVQDAIFIQDESGHFLDVNEGAVQMYGYPKEFFIGRTLESLGAPQKTDSKKIAQAIQLAFVGKLQQFEFWGQRSSGEIFPKDIRLFKGAYFGKEAIIAVAQDITTRKLDEEALHKQFRELSILHLAALTQSTATDSDKLIQQTTDIIGDALYSDNCGILLLNEQKDTLMPHFSYRGTNTENVGVSLPVTQGISGKVIATRRPVRVSDVLYDPSYFAIASGTRSELCVPIISGARIFGVLNVESNKPGTFTERDERLLNTIAGGLANALERIQLFEAEKKRRLEAEFIREATLELTSNFELDRLFENIFSSLAKLISYDSASIELIDQGHIEIVAGKNIPKELVGKKYEADLDRWGGEENFREPKIIFDIKQDERFVKFEPTNYIHGWMGIPLLAQGRIIGFLNLDSRTPGFFTNDHAAIAQTFANQVAIAIEKTRLFELAQRRRKEAENLSLATSSLANTLDIKNLLENILDWLKILAPYDSASIMLKQQDTLELVGNRNLPIQFKTGQVFPMTEKWKEVAASRKTLVIEDVQKDSRFEKWEGTEYIHGWMSVPMFIQDSLIGFINLDSKTRGAFTSEHANLVRTFANQAATAIEKSRLFNLEKKRRGTAETLMRATTELTNLLDLPSLHTAILEWLYKIAPYDSASILEIEGHHVRITAAQGLPNKENVLNQLFPADNILCKLINETGQALIIDDCKEDVRFENWGDSQHVRGWMGVPLISRGQVIGYLTVDSRTPNAFSQDDAVAAQTFAHQAATSLENTRLYIETRQRLEELEMVNRVSFALRAAKDTQEMLPILLNEIKASIQTDAATILLYDPEIDALTPHATSGWLANLPKTTFKPGEGIIGKVYSSGTIHFSPEFISDPMAHPENADFFGEGWGGLAVPIRTASETIGVIIVAIQKPRQIEFHQARLLTTLADIAGNAIYRSSLFQQSERQIRRLTTLREIDTAITSSLDLRITLDILTEHLTAKMGVSAARILVYNPNSQMLDIFTAAGFNNPAASRQPISIGDGLTSQILLSRKELFIKNIKEETELLISEHLSNEGFKSYYALPLFSKGATRGVVETYFKDIFTPTTDWKDFIKTLAGQATIAIDNAQLFENLQRTNQELSLAYDTTLEGWGKALELRDKETQGHTQRVTNLTLELARQMGIPESEITHIRRGALLHDIGKMGVPDNILHKPGKLTNQEMAEMRKHPQYAYDLLSPITYLRPTLDIAYCHHEWWDGSGYPRKLKGEEIPLSARIFAIVDVWDALLSDRPYRNAWSEVDVMNYIHNLSGKQFDPQIVVEFQKMIASKSNAAPANLPNQAGKVPKKKTTIKTKKKR